MGVNLLDSKMVSKVTSSTWMAPDFDVLRSGGQVHASEFFEQRLAADAQGTGYT